MTMLGLGRARRGLNFLLNQVCGRVAILLYHRVADHVPDPQLLCVSPDKFEEHLQYLRRSYHTISLSSLAESLHNGQVPRKAVAITFDDGYVDNLWYAKPLLERYDCPATVFVVSGSVGRDRELVSDELERLLFESVTLPEMLCLQLAGQTYSWKLDGSSPQLTAWDVTQGYHPTLRHRCYDDLHKLLRPQDQSTRAQILAELWAWVGRTPSGRRERRVMSPDELRELVREGLIDVGAHTTSHLLLPKQSAEVQSYEISESKRILEHVLRRPVTSFSYPYGGSDAISAPTTEFVREAGFLLACTNMPGVVQAGVDPFLLPRFLVRNWTGDDFARRLRSFFAE